MSVATGSLRGCATSEPHCITCSDEGIAMTVLTADRASGLARCVDEDGARTEVETALVGDVARGERLLVHAGTAIARVEGESAA